MIKIKKLLNLRKYYNQSIFIIFMSTNIYDLPTNPAVGVGNNISITPPPHPPSETQVSLDQTTINQIVSGLQQASTAGATQLPSRDISQSTESITQDPQIQPNYIPPQQNHQDYISNYETPDISQNPDRLDNMYNEIQLPLFLSILYFLFQLPIVKKQLFNYLPFLFLKDGNMNIHGFVATSVLFGLSFYSINKSMKMCNKF